MRHCLATDEGSGLRGVAPKRPECALASIATLSKTAPLVRDSEATQQKLHVQRFDVPAALLFFAGLNTTVSREDIACDGSGISYTGFLAATLDESILQGRQHHEF